MNNVGYVTFAWELHSELETILPLDPSGRDAKSVCMVWWKQMTWEKWIRWNRWTVTDVFYNLSIDRCFSLKYFLVWHEELMTLNMQHFTCFTRLAPLSSLVPLHRSHWFRVAAGVTPRQDGFSFTWCLKMGGTIETGHRCFTTLKECGPSYPPNSGAIARFATNFDLSHFFFVSHCFAFFNFAFFCPIQSQISITRKNIKKALTHGQPGLVALKLFSGIIFRTWRAVCRLFHAVGAENVKTNNKSQKRTKTKSQSSISWNFENECGGVKHGGGNPLPPAPCSHHAHLRSQPSLWSQLHTWKVSWLHLFYGSDTISRWQCLSTLLLWPSLLQKMSLGPCFVMVTHTHTHAQTIPSPLLQQVKIILNLCQAELFLKPILEAIKGSESEMVLWLW